MHGVDNAHSVSHFRLVCIDWDVAIIIVQASTTTAVSGFANCKRFPKAQVKCGQNIHVVPVLSP